MDNLFIKRATAIEKVAYRVNADASSWPKEALNSFLEDYPEFTSEDLQVNILKKDEERGYGIGSISFRNGTLSVPIIIRDWNLSSFDVLIAANSILPLTRDNLFSLFTNKSAYGTLKPEEDNGDFISKFDPALRAATSSYQAGAWGNSTKMGSLEEDYSFIDKISNTILKDDKEDILISLNNPLTKAMITNNDAVAKMNTKISSIESVPEVDIKESMSHSLPRDIQYIYKTGYNSYKGIFGNKEVHDPIVIDMTSEDVSSFDHIVLSPNPSVKTANSKKIACIKPIGSTNSEIVITEDGNWCEITPSTKIASYYVKTPLVVDNEDIKNIRGMDFLNFSSSIPSAGCTYVLKVGSDYTRPVEVLSTQWLENKLKVDTFDGLYKKSYYIVKGIKGIYAHDTEKNASYIGDDISWVKLQDQIMLDTPEIKMIDHIKKHGDNLFTFDGVTLNKYAKLVKKDEFDFNETMWALIQTGASKIDLEKCAMMSIGSIHEIDNLTCPYDLDEFCNMISEKSAEYIDTDFNKLSYIDHIVKIAVQSPTDTSVDAILSLGFMNKNNLQEFIAQVPAYEQVTSDLAKLLLYIRLGIQSVPEQPVRMAMKELTSVVERLRGIRKLSTVE